MSPEKADDRAELEGLGVFLLGRPEITRGSSIVEARIIARARSEALAELLVVRAVINTKKDGRAHDQKQARLVIVLKLPGGGATYLSLRAPLVPALVDGLRLFLELGEAAKRAPGADREVGP